MPCDHPLVNCKSEHRQGTARITRRIADILHAVVVTPEEVSVMLLDDCDLVGFGSGVYYGRFHRALWDLASTFAVFEG